MVRQISDFRVCDFSRSQATRERETGLVGRIGRRSDSGGAPLQHEFPRRLCCGRVIPSVLDEDPSVGLAARLGLVSDALAFSCNECTTGMIDAGWPRDLARRDAVAIADMRM
jgi:hypothetical protein